MVKATSHKRPRKVPPKGLRPAPAAATTVAPRSGKPVSVSPAGHFGPIKPQRISEEICAQVRSQIAQGKLVPGDRLPTERALAGMFSVSRMAVREGMRNLEVAGLITMRKGRHGGAFIADNGVRLVTQSLNDMVDLGRASLDMLMEVRLHVMDIVVRLACERATEQDFTALATNITHTEELTAAGKFEERTFTAIEFNRLLAAATGNHILRAIVESLSEVLRKSVAQAGIRTHDPTVQFRKTLLMQIRKRKQEAASATMREFLIGLHKHMASARHEKAAPQIPTNAKAQARR